MVNDAVNPDSSKLEGRKKNEEKKQHVSLPAWPEAHILLTERHC